MVCQVAEDTRGVMDLLGVLSLSVELAKTNKNPFYIRTVRLVKTSAWDLTS